MEILGEVNSMNERTDLFPAMLYARISFEAGREFSVAAHMRALRGYTERNGNRMARKYVDESESGRIGDKLEFPQMTEQFSKAAASPIEGNLLCKFNRLARKRKNVVAFRSSSSSRPLESRPSSKKPNIPLPAS